MINDLLNTFIHVVDLGSFSKAAEKLFISSTAIMKQMNALEGYVGVQLLVRTNHGVQATDAGNSFYYDAKFLMQYSEKAIVRAQQTANKNSPVIRIGNSVLNPCKPLLDLWNNFSVTYPHFKIKIVPFDDAEVQSIYQQIGRDFDVMVGAYERANGAHYFNDLKLGEYHYCVAVSREHPLSDKEMISLSDLYGERLVMIKPGNSPSIDEIRRYLLAEHQGIQIKDTPQHYDIDLFNLCEERGAFLLTLDGWKDVHPSLVTIPVDWAYSISYGILYPLEPSNNLQLFLKALQATEFATPS